MRASDPDPGQTTLQDSGSAPRGEHRRSGRRFDALAALGFLLFAFVLVWPVLLGRVPVASDTLYLWAPWSQLPHEPVNTPVLADSSLLFLPWMVFGREAVQAGEWPLWDPHSFAGFPYAANSQNQLYYPLTWLLWLLPLSAHIQVLVVFNIWFAGFGAYLFTRRLAVGRCAAFIAGVAFAGSGIMQLVIELWGVSSVYAWLPWVMYFTDRALTERHSGWTAAAASAVALLLVAGHLQYAVYTLFLLGVWVLWRMATDGRAAGPARVAEYAARSAGIAALGVGAALVHLAPLFELSAFSGRAGARVSSNSPPLSSMLRSLAPQFFGDGGTTGSPLVFNDLWYAGVPALILAVLALFTRPRGVVWLWAGLGAVAMAVGYGIGPFLYARWLPGLSGMLPIRIGYLFVFAVAVLAALGVDTYMRLHAKRPRSALLTLGLVLTLLTLVLGGALALRSETSDAALGALQDQQVARAASISAVTLIALAVVTGILRKSTWRRKAVFASVALLAALQMADLATAVPGYNSYVRPEAIMPASPAVEWLRARSAEGRVLGRGVWSEQPVLVPNVHLLYGLQSVAGYDSLHTRDYEDLWAAVDPTIARGTSSTPYSNVFVRPQAYTSTVAALLGVRYVACTVPLADAGETPAYDGEILIYDVGARFPRAFFVGRADVLEREDLLTRLASDDLDPVDAVLLSAAESPPEHWGAGSSTGIIPAAITQSKLNRVEVRVDAPSDGWLVLGDANYPGWSASVNGEPSKVYSAYLALRSVPLRAGESLVQFEYTPATYAFAVPISTSALIGILSLALLGYRRARQREQRENIANEPM